jgi:hypothetical protein
VLHFTCGRGDGPPAREEGPVVALIQVLIVLAVIIAAPIALADI